MSAAGRSVTTALRGPCPHCRFPVHPDQDQLAVHTGTTRHPGGWMEDRFDTFHRPCAAAHLIGKATIKAAALRTSAGMAPAFFTERTAS